MSNPFEEESGIFEVLINDEDQHSLWPTFMNIPAGWKSVHGPAARGDCIAYIEHNWKDIRPRSLNA